MVFDTDVVVAALRSPTGASAALLRAARAKRLTMVVSVPLMIEYEATCGAAEHRLAAQLSASEVTVFVNAIAALATEVETHYLWRGRLRDPNDEMVLDAAINGRADAIVTFNRRDYGSVPGEFGIDVLLPREALRRLAT